jgi:hypothetical protein
MAEDGHHMMVCTAVQGKATMVHNILSRIFTAGSTGGRACGAGVRQGADVLVTPLVWHFWQPPLPRMELQHDDVPRRAAPTTGWLRIGTI